MSQFYLDVRSVPQAVDFLLQTKGFLAPEEREKAEALLAEDRAGSKISRDEAGRVAREVAKMSWPARYALQRYVSREGAEEEWRHLLAAARPSTAQTLKRCRAKTKKNTLTELLADIEVDAAMSEEERLEIASLRPVIHEALWQEKREALETLVKDGERERAAYDKRFVRLRDLAPGLPPLLQDELYSKLAIYEDRIYVAGETISLEIFDQEVAYYTDQKLSSPLEG